MNREQTYGSVADNQIRAMDHSASSSPKAASRPKQLEAYPDWNRFAKAKRISPYSARAYLDVNCAICHCPGGASNNSLDMRFHTPLAETKLLGTPPAKGDYGPEGSKIITPGDPARSILLTRMKTRGQGKMPPMASSTSMTARSK